MEVLEKLVYGAGVNIADLRRDIEQAKNLFDDLGGTAKQVFGRQIGNELARAIDGKKTHIEIFKIRKDLEDFGKDAVKGFDRTFGRAQAKKIFDPLRDESKSFFGQLKQAFAGGFDFKSIALGTAAGLGAVELGKQLLQAGADSVKFAADFERSLTQVQTIAEKDFNFDAVREQIKALSTEIPQDVLTLTQGLGDIIGAGVVKTTQEAVDLLRISAKSATAGMTDTSTATKAMVFVMNAFKDSNLTASQAADILFRTVDEGVISFTELANNIGEVAAPAALAGVSMEEVGAAVATITRGGINASETMTAMKNLLGDIVAPTKSAAKAAQEMGLDFSKAGIEAAGGLAKFIQKIQEATGGDTEKLKKLFPEDRALKAIQQLAGVSAQTFQDLSAAFLKTGDTAGAMDRAFQTVNKTATEQYQLFKNNLSNAVLSFGSSLLESLKPALQGMNEWMVSFSRTGLENTIARLRELGVESEKLRFLELRSAAENASTEVEKLDMQFRNIIDNAEKFGKTRGLPGFDTRAYMEGSKDVVATFKEIITTAQGVNLATSRLLELNKDFAAITLQITEAEQGRSKLSSGQLQDLNAQKEYLAGQRESLKDLLSLGSKIAEQKKLEQDAEDEISGKKKKQEETTNKVANAEHQITIEKNKQLEIHKNFPLAVDSFSSGIRSKSLLDVKMVLKPIEYDFNAVQEKIDQERKQARDHMTELFGDIGNSFNDFLYSLEDVGVNVNDKLLLLSGSIADGLNSFLPALNKFKDSLKDSKANPWDRVASGFNVASIGASIALPFLKDVFGGLFGGDRAERRRKALEQEQKVSEEARKALEEFNKSLDELRSSLEKSVGQKLSSGLLEVNTQIETILGTAIDFTKADFERFRGLRERETALLQDLEAARNQGDKDWFDQLSEELRSVQGELDEFGVGLNMMTASQLAELSKLLDKQEIYNKAIEEFGKFADSFSGKMDRFNLEVELFDIESVADKLKALSKNIGIVLPDSVEKIDAFVREAFAAFEQGGDTLLKFMSNADLNKFGDFSKMSAEDFLNMIKMLEGFGDQMGKTSEDIKDATEAIADKFSELLGMLELEFDLFDIKDPAEQLKRMREDILKEMNAIIPTTQEGLDAFIKAGFVALQKGEDAVKMLLGNLNLEELTADQFKDLLRRLAGLAREAKGKIDELSPDNQDNLQFGVVRQITFNEANELIDEVSTIREVVTQMLDLGRDPAKSPMSAYYGDMTSYLAETSLLARQQLTELIQIKLAVRQLVQMPHAQNSANDNFVFFNNMSQAAADSNLSRSELLKHYDSVSRARGRGIV